MESVLGILSLSIKIYRVSVQKHKRGIITCTERYVNVGARIAIFEKFSQNGPTVGKLAPLDGCLLQEQTSKRSLPRTLVVSGRYFAAAVRHDPPVDDVAVRCCRGERAGLARVCAEHNRVIRVGFGCGPASRGNVISLPSPPPSPGPHFPCLLPIPSLPPLHPSRVSTRPSRDRISKEGRLVDGGA